MFVLKCLSLYNKETWIVGKADNLSLRKKGSNEGIWRLGCSKTFGMTLRLFGKKT